MPVLGEIKMQIEKKRRHEVCVSFTDEWPDKLTYASDDIKKR